MYTPRFNPNSAVSNWKARLDYLKGYPGAAMSGAMNGGFFGGPLDFSGGSRTNAGGFNYETYTSSGTVTVEGSGEVEFILVGGGGSAGQDGGCGGGGGGGVIRVTGLTVEAGTYSLTIGAGPTNTSGTSNGTNGGNSVLVDLGGGETTACGGGAAGGGGWGVCNNGDGGVGNSTSASIYASSGGGGGGGGEWTGYCGGSGGNGSGKALNGTYSGGGTWYEKDGGNGGNTSSWMGTGGGGGSGYDINAASYNGDGADGFIWNSVMYGRGGDGQNYNSGDQGTAAGSGQSTYAGYGANSRPAKDGILIVKWAEE